ncbi:hypothetical protein LCGC14_1964920 [marine sediment metagenome]|uniref:Uncharacterized protein n=1 Tax=marine sediment metagenome TaxID=412755 RepID=A0A0F9FDE5_9ZZZZ
MEKNNQGFQERIKMETKAFQPRKLRISWTKETYEDVKKYGLDVIGMEESLIERASAEINKERLKIMKKDNNHIWCRKYKWWFWSETYSDEYGPYKTKKKAEKALKKYIKKLNKGK